MPELTYRDDTHQYFLGDRELASVTRILGDLGISRNWGTDYHSAKGTAVHEVCAAIDEGVWDPEATTPVLVPYGRAWEAFRADYEFRPELSEQKVCSPTYGIAGRLDRWGTGSTDRRALRLLVDIKSGAKSPGHRLQKALYVWMLKEWLNCGTDASMIVYLGDDGRYTLDWGEGNDLQAALSIVNAWTWLHKHNLLNGRR